MQMDKKKTLLTTYGIQMLLQTTIFHELVDQQFMTAFGAVANQ